MNSGTVVHFPKVMTGGFGAAQATTVNTQDMKNKSAVSLRVITKAYASRPNPSIP
jgi:hypothetical protein